MAERKLPDDQSLERKRSKRLSLSLLTLEQALGGAIQTGKPPEPKPQNKHAKRTATKRRLNYQSADKPKEDGGDGD
jgi:hypothetical protein